MGESTGEELVTGKVGMRNGQVLGNQQEKRQSD